MRRDSSRRSGWIDEDFIRAMSRETVEFKAELREPALLAERCRLLGGRFRGEERQSDSCFRLVEGRLLRRTVPGREVIWLHYHRRDRVLPCVSRSTLVRHAEAVRRWGTVSLRPWMTVRKTRRVWLLEGLRINVDEIDGLGRFVEFEAPFDSLDEEVRARGRIADVREAMAPLLGEAISSSYAELVAGGAVDEEGWRRVLPPRP